MSKRIPRKSRPAGTGILPARSRCNHAARVFHRRHTQELWQWLRRCHAKDDAASAPGKACLDDRSEAA